MILNILVLLMTASVLHYLNIKLMSKTCYYHGMCLKKIFKLFEPLVTLMQLFILLHGSVYTVVTAW